MGRIKHTHKTTSVMILIIDENRIFAFECKCESPITADIYRPVAIEFTSQLMQTPPGAFISSAILELSRANNWRRSLSACF